MVDLLAQIAERLDATPAQVALAWLHAQKPWVVPIPGTRKLARLDENLAAADLELTATDLNEIETASAAITVQGARYPRQWSDLSTGEHRTVGQPVKTVVLRPTPPRSPAGARARTSSSRSPPSWSCGFDSRRPLQGYDRTAGVLPTELGGGLTSSMAPGSDTGADRGPAFPGVLAGLLRCYGMV